MTDNEFACAAFHAYDIRINADEFTDEFARRLYRSQGWYFKNILQTSKLVLCRDTRKSGAHLLQTAIDCFTEMGFCVEANVLPVSTCQFYFSCIKRPESCGIMFTASHNPAQYAGQKIVGPRCMPIAAGIGPEGGLTAIKKAFFENLSPAPESKTGKQGSVSLFNDTDEYIKSCMTRSGVGKNSLSGIRVCADFLCGSAGNEIMRALSEAGVSLTVRNIVPDGDFPAGSPNPIIKENIQKTIDFMLRTADRFDFALFFDGDGDRIDIRTGDTEEISPSLIMLFIAKALGASAQETNKRIGIDSKAAPYIAWELKKAGFESVLVPNGHSLIKKLFLSANLCAAVEESAHYYIKSAPLDLQDTPDLLSAVHPLYAPTESTLFICLMFFKEWKKNKERFLQLLELQRKTHRVREWSHSYASDSDRAQTLTETEAFFCSRGYILTNTLYDGSPLGASLLEKKWGDGQWCRIAQRSSESEQGLARWMVFSSDEAELKAAVENIEKIACKRAAV